MSHILSGYAPERVFHFFEEICGIPHGSGNEQQISDYIVNFAKSHHLEYRQDDANNVIIRKPASAGYENAPVVMLQGHMDMVCEKNADVDFDFEKEGLKLRIVDDMLYATGTTLGGDDGIAVAYALAILEDTTLSHPELEVVITTDEEVGMKGAQALDVSDLKAKYLINLDNETEGQILTSCAGGIKSSAYIPTRHITIEGVKASIKITGLLGGHSGAEIHCGRANANRLLGRLLLNLRKELNVGVCELFGGMKDNAIPREAFATCIFMEEDIPRALEIVESFKSDMADEFAVSDPNIRIECLIEPSEASTYTVIHPADMERVLFVLVESINGIQTMSKELEGLVESSLNLGILRTEEDFVSFCWAIRSCKRSLKFYLSDQIQYLTEFVGGTYSCDSEYPHWSYRLDSKLRELVSESYKTLFGQDAKIEAIHAGLECGLISEKMPDLDIVAIGPDSIDIHTPNEHVSIPSVERCYRLLLDILQRIKE